MVVVWISDLIIPHERSSSSLPASRSLTVPFNVTELPASTVLSEPAEADGASFSSDSAASTPISAPVSTRG